MEIVFEVVCYLVFAHLIAKRGERTGLFYHRVLILALIFQPFVAIWVFGFRKRRRHPFEGATIRR
jgi:hypothetical protein